MYHHSIHLRTAVDDTCPLHSHIPSHVQHISHTNKCYPTERCNVTEVALFGLSNDIQYGSYEVLVRDILWWFSLRDVGRRD